MRSARLWMLLGVMLAGSFPILAQTNFDEQQGLKPYDSLHGGDLDTVSLTNGSVMVHIPLVSFPQRGSLDLSFSVIANSKQWGIATVCNQQQCFFNWTPMPRGGVLPKGGGGGASVVGAQVLSSIDYWLQGSSDTSSGSLVLSHALVSPDGGIHQLGTNVSYPGRSVDATGLVQTDDRTIILPSGVRFAYANMTTVNNGSQPTAVTDPNGNQITISASGWTDSLNRFIPGSGGLPTQPGTVTADLTTCPAGTASARNWDIPSVDPANGGATGTRRFKLCYSNFTIATSFGHDGTEYGPATNILLSAIVLPDLSLWTFAYDSYGDISQVGFPTQGYLKYTYGVGPFHCSGQTDSRWVTSRIVNANDGTGDHTWTYQYAPTTFNGQPALQVTVTTPPPDSNVALHTMIAPVAGTCGYYEAQAQYYQGAATGTPIKTTTTQYTANPDAWDTTIANNVVATQTTVTTSDGHSSKTIVTYDSGNSFGELDLNGVPITVPVVFGSVLQKDEYDFSNTLARTTVNHFKWQDDANYKNSNFLGLQVSSILKDGGGCEMAKTSNGYDETYLSITLQPASVTTQHGAAPWPVRGNHTSSSRWLISNCAEQSAVTSHTIPYDTGLAYQSYDPLGHMTQYTYSSAFAGAYLTQTNLPDTQMPDPGAPIVHHIISGNYDFNTGLLTSFTDENSQSFTYTYDDMLRLTQGNHPDAGITKFSYPDSNTVQRQRLITGTTYDDFKVKFDGLGRPYQTQQLTPDCASYIRVDTTYDVVGRTKSVSNPYCLTSEPTYGITQTDYDALSRATKVTKQDGSFTTVKYEDTPGDTSGAPLTCTTATDESGKKRQACSDAFGRLVKVIEPNPGAAATNATGSVTVSGSEQTANSQPATSGQTTITISGTEQKVCRTQLSCNPTTGPFIYDTGTVSITVAGFTAKSVNYGQGDTPATIAWKLSCAFHNDGASAADASCPGSAGSSTQVVLTARATGAVTNYAFTTASATTDTTGNFFSASFTPGPASGAFTNGQNASSMPDTGNVTITINGTPYSTSFGAGDTYTIIASRLATAISAGPYASATPSGGTVSLASKTAGTPGDYSLTASYTWNSAQFTNPSFTTSTSGSALSGAKDASALNNNPFVTLYQYNVRGDMLCVHQKATDTSADVPCTGTSAPSVPATWRQRFFTYDSLSRLLTASNPEISSVSGPVAITYQYDNDVNVLSKTGPAPNQSFNTSPVQMLTITYTYDALNRLLDTTFSDGTTLKASHRYDYATFQGQSFTNPIWREVAAVTVNSSGSTVASTFASYDVMGRVANTVQCNPSVSGCKIFTASYDKLGDLTTLAYPGNGFTVTYGYDSAARLTTATDSNGVIYAQTPTYLASGAIQEFTSPNFANNKYHVNYNNRLQPIEIWAGTAQGSAALFDKQYSYGTAGANNGNIFTITNVKDSTRTQTFTYDPLNRLLSAGDNGHWANSYTYDAWGNLTNKTPGAPAGENMNQPADANNHLSGLTYDAAGNVKNDGLGGAFVFDGENRITTAGSVTYTYDADGRRIQKSSGTNYWYGPSGSVLAETDSAGNWTNYIFFGGQRLARNVSGDIKYYITDHLHSAAMFVDKAGTTAAILDDNDMYPWGGVVPGVGKTTSNNTIKFTGQYRDADTAANLDYFGARYYSNTIARFMTPDWASAPATVPYAKFGDPQNLNLYSYGGNSPINRIDINGHFDDPFGTFDGGGTFSNIQSRDNLRFDVEVTTTYTYTTSYYPGGSSVTTVTSSSEITSVSLSTSDSSHPCRQSTCTIVATSDDYRPARQRGEMATRDIAYQVKDAKGHDVHNVEVKLQEEIVAGKEDKNGICAPCSNKATPNQEDFISGQFHDWIHASMATGASYSVRQKFFVDGGQVQIQFGNFIYWSQTIDVRYDVINLRPDPLP
jgi:RHS repeat-associated protein